MLYGLLMTAETVELLLEYAFYIAVIVVALTLIGAMKRKTKKELKPESVRSCCIRAKNYAETLLRKGTANGRAILASTKLIKLNSYVEEAGWLAYQIVERKKDIVFEAVASSLDGLATKIVGRTEDGYVPAEEYEKGLKEVISGLEKAIEKLDGIIGK